MRACTCRVPPFSRDPRWAGAGIAGTRSLGWRLADGNGMAKIKIARAAESRLTTALSLRWACGLRLRTCCPAKRAQKGKMTENFYLNPILRR